MKLKLFYKFQMNILHHIVQQTITTK